MTAHQYPIIPDIGLKVRKTFITSFTAFEREWKFKVRSQSEANIAKSCLTYYKPMWDWDKFDRLNKQDIVIDIGAHVGFFAVPVGYLVKRVIAFEPAPANYTLLERNITLNKGNVHPQDCAIGTDIGITTLNLGVQGTTGHSITNAKRGGVSVRVACRSIQDVIGQYRPTVLKLDCEGAEWDILTDPSCLSGIRIIVAEMHKVSQHSLPKVVKVLKQAGMKVTTQPNSWFTKLIAYRK